MSRPLILIVEDDAIIAELIAFNLENDGFLTRHFDSGESMLNAQTLLSEAKLIVLDIMLPGMDGFEICQKLKAEPLTESIPVLMLTARGTERDKVQGLETGADDYLTKPFGMREFLARVRVLLRRYHKARPEMKAGVPSGSGHVDGGPIQAGDLILHDNRHRVFKGDSELELTHREYELLKFLMIHRGVAYSRDDLLRRVWGYDYTGETRTVDVHIRQLRRKIEDDDARPKFIETVRGRGYRFTDRDAATRGG